MRYIYPLALAAALALVGGVAYFNSGSMMYTRTTVPAVVSQPPAATSTVTTSTAPGSYTLADVAKHATASDCWTAINGSVYNLTPFIPVHPGGDVITAVCGIDGTSLFEGQHGNNRQANAELAQLKIGTLSQ